MGRAAASSSGRSSCSARDRVLKEIFLRYPPGEGRLATSAPRCAALEELIDRARAEGELRADFTVADLAVLFWSFGPVIDATERRHRTPGAGTSGLLDGLRRRGRDAADEPPLDDEQLIAATSEPARREDGIVSAKPAASTSHTPRQASS